MKKNLSKGLPALALGLLLCLVPGCENLAGNPAGAGLSRMAAEPTDPIPITSAADLALIGTSKFPPNGDYILAQNIALPADWIPPVPDDGNPFSGTFDGRGNSITITGFDTGYAGQYLGIFGYIDGGRAPAVISNLTIILSMPQQFKRVAEYVGGLAGYIGNATITNVSVSGSIDYTAGNVVYIGGIAGYLQGGSITGTQTNGNLTISAVSPTSTVYAGGLAGYGNAVRISQSAVASGSVTADGQGHNTSGGGIAGYVTNGSTVSSCSVNISVAVTATGAGSSASDLFMAYGGGLLGYSGNGSITEQSSASGDVFVNSPYPYAGGLVGYNYGNLAGTQGSTIRRCYATGNVAADATNANPSLPAGLPYAGGLAGYNSSQLATIENSYATGAVLAETTIGLAWAGGVVGANANNGTVARCYSTGAVKAEAGEGPLPFPQPGTSDGALAGGIVGYSYFTATTLVDSCVALNGTLTASATGATLTEAYRVVGRNGDGSTIPRLNNNYGNSSMGLTPAHSPMENTPAGRDGGDETTSPLLPDEDFYAETLGWDFDNVWQMTSPNTYPILR